MPSSLQPAVVVHILEGTLVKPQERHDAIFSSAAPPTWKLILLTVASHMDDDDANARPGVDRLTRLTGLGERQVRQVIRDMERAGLLGRISRGTTKPPWTVIHWPTLAMFAGVAKTARGGNHCQGRGGKDCQGGVAKTAPDPHSGSAPQIRTDSHIPDPAPVGALPAEAGDSEIPAVQDKQEPAKPRNGVDYPALWATLCGIRGGKALLLTDARRKALKGAVAEIGAQGVEQIARWVASSTHQRAVFLREGGHDSPDTYLRASHRGEYLDLARGAAADPETASADPSDPYPWVEGMSPLCRPDPRDRPYQVRGKALDRRDWYEARHGDLKLVQGGE